jgi:2'-5' RNA ligase
VTPVTTLPRLFTALVPPPEALERLRARLAADPRRWPPEGWRAVPVSRWHLTLCFHGPADPGVLARELDERAAGRAAPWLRLAGAVAFRRVSAAGVEVSDPADAAALSALVRAAGGDLASFRAHLTVARTSRRSDVPPPGGPLAGFVGAWWRPAEVCLVRSDLTSGSPRYTVLHRVALHLDPARGEPSTGPPPGVATQVAR